MLVVDLVCAKGHGFEGWFASGDDLASQKGRGLLSCPLCGNAEIERRPSAPRLNVSGATAPEAGRPRAAGAAHDVKAAEGGASRDGGPAAAPSNPAAAMQAAWIHAVREVLQRTEDVGSRFADEARRIHHGEAPERAIRGQATARQAQELKEEGIEVASLPIPDALKQTLQ